MRVRVRVKTLRQGRRHGARHVRAALAACPHEHALSRGSGAPVECYTAKSHSAAHCTAALLAPPPPVTVLAT